MSYKMLLAKISDAELEIARWDLRMSELDVEFQEAAKRKEEAEGKLKELRKELNNLGDK